GADHPGTVPAAAPPAFAPLPDANLAASPFAVAPPPVEGRAVVSEPSRVPQAAAPATSVAAAADEVRSLPPVGPVTEADLGVVAAGSAAAAGGAVEGVRAGARRVGVGAAAWAAGVVLRGGCGSLERGPGGAARGGRVGS